MFSCKFCEISKNTVSCRTPPVATSGFNEVMSQVNQLYESHCVGIETLIKVSYYLGKLFSKKEDKTKG